MNVIATIQADLETSPLGMRSRLVQSLKGTPILRRTVERVTAAKRVGEIHVLCPDAQVASCADILAGTGAKVRAVRAEPPSWAPLVQTARKWSLDGWRGGVGGTTYFDEFADPRAVSEILREVTADAVMIVPPAAPRLDSTLADAMIEHHRALGDDTRLTFTQAPPGLAGILLAVSLVHEAATQNMPLGGFFSYKPDDPQRDLIFQPCCFEIPPDLRYAAGRLTADTDRSLERLTALMDEVDAPDLAAIGRWVTERDAACTEAMPREVEIELTTQDPYPDALLRPRGSRIDSRGPIDVDLVGRIAEELKRYDDSLLVLGGFGDPLRHPQFEATLKAIRSERAGAGRLFGLAVRTSGVDLTDERIEAMVVHDVDVVAVALDAWTPALYARLQSPNDPAAADLDLVLSRLDRLAEIRNRHGSVKPIVVPEMIKARENVHELEDFHDGWLRRGGAVTIAGHSHYAGQTEDRSVIRMAPAPRRSCRRIRSRCLILADGRMALCDQDMSGLHCAGVVGERSLENVWQGEATERIRRAHREGSFDPTPLCAACEDWHRP